MDKKQLEEMTSLINSVELCNETLKSFNSEIRLNLEYSREKGNYCLYIEDTARGVRILIVEVDEVMNPSSVEFLVKGFNEKVLNSEDLVKLMRKE